MDLIPSERAVLKIIRVMTMESASPTHPVTLLRSRWPALHSDAYSGGYAGLVRRGLVKPSTDGRVFSVTPAGLQAMKSA